MTRVLLHVVALATLAAGSQGCGSPEAGPLPFRGELGVVDQPVEQLFLDEQGRIFAREGPRIYSLDVADPREPQILGVAEPEGLDCDLVTSLTCQTMVVEKTHGFLLYGQFLARIPLPNGRDPDWILDFPAGGFAVDMALLSNGTIAVLRRGGGDQPNDLLLVDGIATQPDIVAQLQLDYESAYCGGSRPCVKSQGDRLYVLSEFGVVVVYNNSDPTDPVEVERIYLSLPKDPVVAALTFDIDGQYAGVLGGCCWGGSWFRWYELDGNAPHYRDELLGEVNGNGFTLEGGYSFSAGATIHGGHAFPALNVHRLDSEEGFVHIAAARARSEIVGRIAVESERGLVYVGGGGRKHIDENKLQILDFGTLTTGEPSWP